MNRIELIQKIFKKTDFKTYLEIGCHAGHSFFPIRAKNKLAVDPAFKIPFSLKLKWVLKNTGNLKNRYYQQTSDDFFIKRSDDLKKLKQLDVVLIDGLHTYRASLNDVLNSLKYLNTKGIIILHDCFPPHEAAALPTANYPTEEERKGVEGWTGQWCGDVWKTIVFLRRKMPDMVDALVVNTDYGLGIVRLKSAIDQMRLSIDESLFAEVDQLTYKQLAIDPQSMIGLKEPEYTEVIIKEMTV